MDEITVQGKKQPVTILVVDDCASLADGLSIWLRKRGFGVLQASDGNTGLNMCQNETVDIALVDIVMPEKEGIGTICEMRNLYPTMGILAMSGVNPMYLDNALALGADGALAKPFRMKELLREIDRILNRQHTPV